ncbi:formate/nitrite transporter family protein [Burkholderia cepacia]|uniref:formate/nitrite transporter family protein n=1 Tax=Burkholderia cepacia TaxID=292 RepID=UPI0022A8B8DE|nr:formate/nitrite transporter family protein [Burkholderia cepacia]
MLLTDGSATFFKAVELKMTTPAVPLFAKGLTCNWLVCLAIWMAARTSNDGAKLGLSFAFVASGVEQRVANRFVSDRAASRHSHAGGRDPQRSIHDARQPRGRHDLHGPRLLAVGRRNRPSVENHGQVIGDQAHERGGEGRMKGMVRRAPHG